MLPEDRIMTFGTDLPGKKGAVRNRVVDAFGKRVADLGR